MTLRLSILILSIGIFFINAAQAQTIKSVTTQSITVNDKQIMVHSLKSDNKNAIKKPTIILLSGPNENWHSDSAWFALTQQQLSKDYNSYAIDRAGFGGSISPASSYTEFSNDLYVVLSHLNIDNVVFVAFASANISVALFEQKYHSKINIKGTLLIDPDTLTPDAVAFYKDYPTSWYKEHIIKINEKIATGAWTDQTISKNKRDLDSIHELLKPAHNSLMNWDFYHQIANTRTSINGQTARATSIAKYSNDLDNALTLPFITRHAVSVINTDFELHNLPEEANKLARIKHWKNEGDEWAKKVAKQSDGQYIELTNSDHLVTFQQPIKVLSAIKFLAQ